MDQFILLSSEWRIHNNIGNLPTSDCQLLYSGSGDQCSLNRMLACVNDSDAACAHSI